MLMPIFEEVEIYHEQRPHSTMFNDIVEAVPAVTLRTAGIRSNTGF
jgi:hypothetical protein